MLHHDWFQYFHHCKASFHNCRWMICHFDQQPLPCNVSGMNKYGEILKKGEGVEVNKEEAAQYFKMAADRGNPAGMFNYGNMLYKGEGVEINKEEAARYFKMAADSGNPDGMFKYGIMLDEGEGVEVNKKEAARYFKMAMNLFKINRTDKSCDFYLDFIGVSLSS